MKTATADSNCFQEFAKLHSLVIGSERTPSVSPIVSGKGLSHGYSSRVSFSCHTNSPILKKERSHEHSY
jgi:hypothetical protein